MQAFQCYPFEMKKSRASGIGESSESDINLPCMFINDPKLYYKKRLEAGKKVRKVATKDDGLRLQGSRSGE